MLLRSLTLAGIMGIVVSALSGCAPQVLSEQGARSLATKLAEKAVSAAAGHGLQGLSKTEADNVHLDDGCWRVHKRGGNWILACDQGLPILVAFKADGSESSVILGNPR
jgi:hypothetical protein